MNWPTHTDYQDAIQNPQSCFSEPDLKAGEPKFDMLGLPRVMSGNFASVYELKTADSRWAIRCFVRQIPGQQGRYARLSQYLASVKMDYLVNFDFILKGILVKGDWYPIVKMQWVEGLPMNQFVEEIYNDRETMLNLAGDWRTLVDTLRKYKLAHGDLQHGNVMITPDKQFRLVDYDGMYAPVFGRGKAPELGHINFQHPRRTGDFYDETLDNFSAMIVFTSFRALAAEPDLFQKFYTGDNLIFLSADFKAPMQSPLLARLKKSPDPLVAQLAELIEKSCIGPVEAVPDFGELMTATDGGSLSEVKSKVSSAQSSAPATAAPLAINELLAKAAQQSGTRPAPQYTGRPGTQTFTACASSKRNPSSPTACGAGLRPIGRRSRCQLVEMGCHRTGCGGPWHCPLSRLREKISASHCSKARRRCRCPNNAGNEAGGRDSAHRSKIGGYSSATTAQGLGRACGSSGTCQLFPRRQIARNRQPRQHRQALGSTVRKSQADDGGSQRWRERNLFPG